MPPRRTPRKAKVAKAAEVEKKQQPAIAEEGEIAPQELEEEAQATGAVEAEVAASDAAEVEDKNAGSSDAPVVAESAPAPAPTMAPVISATGAAPLPPWLNPQLGINPQLQPGWIVANNMSGVMAPPGPTFQPVGNASIPQKELKNLKMEQPKLPSGEPDPRCQYFDCRGKTALAALTEFCDKKKLQRPEYVVDAPEVLKGPTVFSVTVKLCGMEWGWGKSPSKATAKHLAANETLKMLVTSYTGTECVIPGLEVRHHYAAVTRGAGLQLTTAGGAPGADAPCTVGEVPALVEEVASEDGRVRQFSFGTVPEWPKWTTLLNTFCQLMGLQMPKFETTNIEKKTIAGKTVTEYECRGELIVDKEVNPDMMPKPGTTQTPVEVLGAPPGQPAAGPLRVPRAAEGQSKKDAQHKCAARLLAAVLPAVAGLDEATDTMDELKKHKRATSRAAKRKRQAESAEDRSSAAENGDGGAAEEGEETAAAAAAPGGGGGAGAVQAARHKKNKAARKLQAREQAWAGRVAAVEAAVDAALAATALPQQCIDGAIKFRRAVESDLDSLFALVKEFAKVEEQESALQITADELRRDLFGTDKFFYSIVAEKEEEDLVGFAFFSPSHATWLGRTLYLEDLYLRAAEQRTGAGKALLEVLARAARELGCAKLTWQALSDNEQAHTFYEMIGAKKTSDWISFQMDKNAIDAFTKK
eukprot:CAMPEP_0194671490 /NCGR_PEP_ID=MMETSP0295-20121207/5847_1 /TAXON_ID=39354 /ORGANISM="Heterosigma akashiwo, Strain CCMP2393" /LENGTH=699 /DNA_ID=CAMNT_0039554951 /DNA_START=80 /DNA_END=2183 /DNA_ORIENTATION=+